MRINVEVTENMTSKDALSSIRKKVAMELFKTNKFSTGYCADLSGLPYADFLLLLSENKISILSSESLKDDFKTINEI